MGHKELLPEPDLEDRKKAKAAKPGTTEVIILRSRSLLSNITFQAHVSLTFILDR